MFIMTTLEILNLAGSLGVPAVVLIMVIWKGFPFLTSIIGAL